MSIERTEYPRACLCCILSTLGSSASSTPRLLRCVCSSGFGLFGFLTSGLYNAISYYSRSIVHYTHLFCLLFLLGLFLRLLLFFFRLLFSVKTVLPRARLLLRLPSLLLLLLDTLDAGIHAQRQVNQLPQTCSVLLLSAGALGLVLLLGVALVVAAVLRVNETSLCRRAVRRTCR